MSKIDEFLYFKDDPNSGISIYNENTKQYEVLTEEEIAEVERLRKGTFTDVNYNPYPDAIDYFSGVVQKLPINCTPEPKRRFMPSVSEARKINKLMIAIRNGLLKDKNLKSKKVIKDIWSDHTQETKSNKERRRLLYHYDAPKMNLPSTAESYRTTDNYLNKLNIDYEKLNDEEKRGKYIPKVYSCLRHVPYYDVISQNFERCLDIYMAPRKQKLMTNIDPDELLPKMPTTQELPLFPTWECLTFGKNTSNITCLCIHPLGELIATSYSDGTLIIWEYTGIELYTYNFKKHISYIEWHPDPNIYYLSIVYGSNIFILFCEHGSYMYNNKQLNSLSTLKLSINNIKWRYIKNDSYQGVKIIHCNPVCKFNYNIDGNYMLSITNDKSSRKQIYVHKLSTHESQILFKPSLITSDALFNGSRAEIFIIGKKHIKVFDLDSQTITRKLYPGVNMINKCGVYLSSNHLVVGDDNNKICWFDLDLSNKPYKVFKFLKSLLCNVNFHPKYPLMLCSTNDPLITIVYSKISHDLSVMPTIIPVKVLNPVKGNNTTNVISCMFHPQTPSVYSCDQGGLIRLFE